jgi:hypothetical protein
MSENKPTKSTKVTMVEARAPPTRGDASIISF